MGRSAPPQTADAVLPGRLAEMLADHGEAGLTEALDLVVAELGLRSAVLRDLSDAAPVPSAPSGRLRAVAGDAVHAVPTMRVVSSATSAGSTVELPIRAGGREVCLLSVLGARPSQLPVLRAVAAVLGLALARTTKAAPVDAAAELVAAADAEADAAADLLHDGPVQALVVAHYAAEAAARGGDPGAAREAVQAALVELRRSLWHLRPRGPGEGGLPGALALLSGRLEEAGRPPLGFVLDELVAAALPSAVASTAYRLVQAVALPEGADPVRVALRREGSTVVLDLEGGAPLADADRWANKAKALGGTLTSSGARTRLAIPLTAPRTKATS
jgi:signal transduction histidine kinase